MTWRASAQLEWGSALQLESAPPRAQSRPVPPVVERPSCAVDVAVPLPVTVRPRPLARAVQRYAGGGGLAVGEGARAAGRLLPVERQLPLAQRRRRRGGCRSGGDGVGAGPGPCPQ